MRVVVVKDYKELSFQAAQIVAGQIKRKCGSVLGLPTGQTPVGMYQELIERCRDGETDFSQVITFNLDEYYGLNSDNPQSYHYFMQDKFFNRVNIKKENTYLLDGVTKDIEGECQRYEELIKTKGGIDLQVLGIGENGHIGFNEPATKLRSQTHLVNLSEETIKVNSRYFNDVKQVPRQALTMGIGSIMQAKKIILLASGRKKAQAIVKTLEGLVSAETPASFLQLHNDVTILIDEEAAEGIK